MTSNHPRRDSRFSLSHTLVSWTYIAVFLIVMALLAPNIVIVTGDFIAGIGHWAEDTRHDLVDNGMDAVTPTSGDPVVVDPDRVPYNGAEVCQQACDGSVEQWDYVNETAVTCTCQ